MHPRCLAMRPRMVRVKTDLPMPEPPTKPITSPLKTSRLSPFKTILSPNPTSRSRTLIATSRPEAVGRIDGDLEPAMGAELSIRSKPDRAEEDGKKSIDHDDHEDRFDHRSGDLPSKRFRR